MDIKNMVQYAEISWILFKQFLETPRSQSWTFIADVFHRYYSFPAFVSSLTKCTSIIQILQNHTDSLYLYMN